MVFMGSEAFPVENAYDSYLQQHGGGSNAYTEAEQTVFHCDVAPGSLRGALERFAAQFVAPLCCESAAEREVRAVESEFTQALQSDGSRLLQVQCASAPPAHPAAMFSWGNAQSLVADVAARGLSLRELLLRHLRQHYRADRMTLCVLGCEELDTLQAWTEELFARVPGGPSCAPSFLACGSPLAPTHATLTRTPSVKDAHQLSFSFALPPLEKHYLSKPEEYASHLLGHEGAGSLLSALKLRGLASGLSAGVPDGGHERSSCGWTFGVCVTLTQAGLHDWPAVAQLVFDAAALLRHVGPQEWVFQELRAAKEAEFRFAEEEEGGDYTTRLAANAWRYPGQHAVSGESLVSVWDPLAVQDCLQRLTPGNCRLDLQSVAFAGEAGLAALEAPLLPGGQPVAVLREPWMGVPYSTAPVPPALLAAWARPPAAQRAAWPQDLALPPRNSYIPTDFSLVGWGEGVCVEGPPGEEDDAAYPVVTGTQPPLRAPAPPVRLALPGARLRGWHKADGRGGRFGAPRAAAFFAFASSCAASTPGREALTQLALRVSEDALAECTYLADVAGLRCQVSPDGARFELKLDGFSHKLPLLAQQLFASLVALPEQCGDAGRVSRCREALLRRLHNALLKPAKHAAYLRLRALRAHAHPLGEQLAAVSAADGVALAAHAAQLLRTANVDALLAGNLERGAAAQLLRDCAASLPGDGGGAPVGEPVLRVPACAVLGRPALLLFDSARNPSEDNSCTESYFQVGLHADPTPADRALCDLAAQLLSEPAFHTLRTQEQLGYTVSSGVRNTHGVLGFCLHVQSAKQGCHFLDGRMEAFLAAFAHTLQAMPDAEFARNKASLISAKLQKDRAVVEEAERWWDAVWHRHWAWGLREQEASAVAQLTKAQLIAWYGTHLAPDSQQRRKMEVRVSSRARAEEEQLLATQAAAQGVLIVGDDQAAFRQLQDTWGCFQPQREEQPAE